MNLFHRSSSGGRRRAGNLTVMQGLASIGVSAGIKVLVVDLETVKITRGHSQPGCNATLPGSAPFFAFSLPY
jgi:hypothetical protein